MAIFSKIIAISALAALVSAAPLNIPRDMRTVTETEWTTREVPVTLWVDGNGKPISTEVPGGNFAEQSHKTLESRASDSASCEGSGNACEGDITHWDGGLGACGWDVNSASDMQIALPYGFMGTQSNGNPYCGRSLTIKNPTTGTTIQATVGDKCMGCTGRSIDLTNAAFAAVGNGCDGRCSGFEWWFN